MVILVTSAGAANGGGYDSVLRFDGDGQPTGEFSSDPRIADPRGLYLDRSSTLIYLNSGADRVLALDQHGRVVRDSGKIPGLDPGGGLLGPDGRYYLGTRERRTILAMPAALDGDVVKFLPDGVVPFPRGFGFADDGRLYLASGVGPSGGGDNTVVVFEGVETAQARRLVSDPELSPLDLTIAPNGNIVVASEHPFGTRDAVSSIREYDPASGNLVRVFMPDRSLEFQRPRGLRFGADNRLYCVGEGHVVVFDFLSGDFLGAAVTLPGLHGQALVLLSSP
jgi:DNA-binding beta-propeller fold protein YncE